MGEPWPLSIFNFPKSKTNIKYQLIIKGWWWWLESYEIFMIKNALLISARSIDGVLGI